MSAALHISRHLPFWSFLIANFSTSYIFSHRRRCGTACPQSSVVPDGAFLRPGWIVAVLFVPFSSSDHRHPPFVVVCGRCPSSRHCYWQFPRLIAPVIISVVAPTVGVVTAATNQVQIRSSLRSSNCRSGCPNGVPHSLRRVTLRAHKLVRSRSSRCEVRRGGGGGVKRLPHCPDMSAGAGFVNKLRQEIEALFHLGQYLSYNNC